MTVLLGSILMGDELLTGDKAVFAFFELLAIGCVCACADTFAHGQYVAGSILFVAFVVFFFAGIKWAAIKKRWSASPAAKAVDTIISNYRWRLLIVALVLGGLSVVASDYRWRTAIIISALSYAFYVLMTQIERLRHDLVVYAMAEHEDDVGAQITPGEIVYASYGPVGSSVGWENETKNGGRLVERVKYLLSLTNPDVVGHLSLLVDDPAPGTKKLLKLRMSNGECKAITEGSPISFASAFECEQFYAPDGNRSCSLIKNLQKRKCSGALLPAPTRYPLSLSPAGESFGRFLNKIIIF